MTRYEDELVKHAERVERTERTLRTACIERGFPLSGDDRIGEADAASLVGLSHSRMRQLRSEKVGPPAYSRSVQGAKVTYRLHDLAAWLERGRDTTAAD